MAEDSVLIKADQWLALDLTPAVSVDDAECPTGPTAAQFVWREGDPFAGVTVPVPEVDVDGPARLALALRGDGIVRINVSAIDRDGNVFTAPVGPAKEGWRSVTLSSHAMVGAGTDRLNGKDITEVRVWYAGPADAPEVGVPLERVPVFADGNVVRVGTLSIGVEPVRPTTRSYDGPVIAEDGKPLTPIEPHPIMAMHLDYAAMDDQAKIDSSAARARSLGCGLLEAPNHKWFQFEPTDGEWDWSVLDPLANAARENGLKLVSCVGSLGLDQPGAQSDRVHLPDDLAFDGDYTKLLPRYRRFMDAFFERYADVTYSYMLHSEGCSRYFARHEAEPASYRDFLFGVGEHLHQIAPGVELGACMENYETEAIIKLVNEVTDVASLLFQPGQGRTHPSWIPDQWARFLELAGDKRIGFSETYQWSSEVVGYSAELQADMVRHLFDILRENLDRISWVSWWGLHDDDIDIWANIGRMLVGGVDSPFGTWLRELHECGLLRGDGTLKPAGRAWIEGIESLRA